MAVAGISVPLLAVVTYDVSRIEYVEEHPWGTETFLQVTERRIGITTSYTSGLVAREFAEPGPETTTETRTRVVRGPRYGAICWDGWQSSATGRGACSWHGGVARWLTSDTEVTYRVEVPVPPPAPPPGMAECRNTPSGDSAGRCSDLAWAAVGPARSDLDIRSANSG